MLQIDVFDGESGLPGRSSVHRCRVRHGLIDPQARKLQITTSTGGAGPPAGVFDEPMAGAQSAEDGAAPLLMCMLSPDAQSGDFFGPSIAGALGPYATGPAKKHEPEPFCTGPENTQLLWTASAEAIGETLVLG